MSMQSTPRSQLPSQQRDVLAHELTRDELYDHVIQVLPNVRAVAASPALCGPGWRLKRERHGVRLHEYDAYTGVSRTPGRPRAMSDVSGIDANAALLRRWPWSRPTTSERLDSSTMSYLPPLGGAPPSLPTRSVVAAWPNASSGVPFAAVAQCDLSCPVSEALDVLFSADHDATMRALWGAKYYRGDELHNEQYDCQSPTGRFTDRSTAAIDVASGRLSVHTTVLAPRHDLHLRSHSHSRHDDLHDHNAAQQLCFAMYTHRAPQTNEAFVVLKTLPKRVHEQLVAPSAHAALRGGVDHVAVGYHLVGSYSDVTGHHTRLVMCAYVSTFSGAERPAVVQWRIGLRAAHDRAHRDAKYVVRLLAAAASEFERVVRRRRFGLAPLANVIASSAPLACCRVCTKRFGLLRRAELCELCGHGVCRRCSRKYEVEPPSSSNMNRSSSLRTVHKRRACYTCASRIEHRNGSHTNSDKASTVSIWRETLEAPSCDDSTDDDAADEYRQSKASSQQFSRTLVLPLESLESPKPGHQLAEALFSPHPLDRARALEVLKVAVKQVTTQPAADWHKPLDPALVGKYLEARQRLSRISSKGSATEAAPVSMYDTDNDSSSSDFDSSRSFPIFYQPHKWPSSTRSASGAAATARSRGFAALESRNPMRVDDDDICSDIDDIDDIDDSISDIDSDSDGLDAICAVAAQRMRCPMAFVAVLGRDELHVVGAYQVPGCIYRVPRNQSTRSFGLLADGAPLVAHQPMQDARLRHMPLVRDAGVRFFAGFPVLDYTGAVVAAICTIDTLPHDAVARDELAAMTALTKLAADAFAKSAVPPSPASHSSHSSQRPPLAPCTPRSRRF